MSEMSIIIKNKKYEIIKELGKGGNGKVIQVLNTLDNKFYAIKEIEIKEDIRDKIKNIENEANILSKFNCKNIVKYYDSYKDNKKFCILMEYCDGQNLKDFIDKNKNKNELIEENILYNIIKQICIGIKEIHSKNIIHRDLKPENIFMNYNKEIKIGDFGISKYFGGNKVYTTTLNKAGSIYYIAPEIIRKGIYNEKSDMYSLGCIIYELFNLNIYYNDKFDNEIKKIDSNIYNSKWQEIINSLSEIDHNKRKDINTVYDIILNEININELKIKINNLNIEKEKDGVKFIFKENFITPNPEEKFKHLLLEYEQTGEINFDDINKNFDLYYCFFVNEIISYIYDGKIK